MFIPPIRPDVPAPVVDLAVGVGHPISPLSDVRSTDARCRKRHKPEGVSHSFQVSLYKVEPCVCVTACNLFAKDMLRSALADEVEEVRPKVPLVSKPITFACRAERLARAGTGPDWFIVRPSGEAQ